MGRNGSGSAHAAVEALGILLDRIAARIDVEELELLANLEDFAYSYTSANTLEDFGVTLTREVNCSRVCDSARAELLFRGASPG